MPEIVRIDLHHPDASLMTRAAAVVARGGLLVYPTETLYGIGADARQPAAVDKVRAAKRRPDGKPILVIVASQAEALQLIQRAPAAALRLMEVFWPGPLTLVLPAAASVPRTLHQGTGTIGVRVPGSTFCLQLLQACACPLTSTSANISGGGVPESVQEVAFALGDAIDWYLDAGPLPSSLPSTVVDVCGPIPRVLRAGAIPTLRLQETIGDLVG